MFQDEVLIRGSEASSRFYDNGLGLIQFRNADEGLDLKLRGRYLCPG